MAEIYEVFTFKKIKKYFMKSLSNNIFHIAYIYLIF